MFWYRVVAVLSVAGSVVAPQATWAGDPIVVKRVVRSDTAGPNRLRPDAWQPWQQGFEIDGAVITCHNGSHTDIERGASQSIVLNQAVAEPIVATAASRAVGVTGSPDPDYALYLDLQYTDGTHLWGQSASFDTGTHDWQSRRVLVVPEKPIQVVTVHLLLRRHGGQAWFRDPELRVLATPPGATRFDGTAIVPERPATAGFQVRDVAADSDFVRLDQPALDLALDCVETEQHGATWFDVTLRDLSGTDRAVTLFYTAPCNATGGTWLEDPRRTHRVEKGREYTLTSHLHGVGSNGRLSRYPLGGAIADGAGLALGIDMAFPAFYRIGLHAGTSELFLAYDVGLTPEKPTARFRFCRFAFDPQHEFRGALQRYYELFPDAFHCRTPHQGLWMPFAKISDVENWEDFGFRFKEGDNETAWDDQHGILTFRYTEPLTWWMPLAAGVPRTVDAAVAAARELADVKQQPQAQALFHSGYRDSAGDLVAQLLDTPWCNGAVWSMNSLPGIPARPSDFSLKWNADLRERLYGPGRAAELDGEYIDSSEGYVTAVLDYARDHFAAADTPLCYASGSWRPAVLRGLIAFEYAREIARDIRQLDRLMMANATPIQLCWLAPLLDVLGTETDWNWGGRWQPMSDAELLYRRVLSKGKPFCFLMNTRFEDFPPERVERYMQRALAYGMFPGFFSHNASEGHYFTRPDLYNRDRPLFRKYVPLCRRVAEAGWEPVTRATSSDPQVYVERFGERLLTVFNDSEQRRAVTIRCAVPELRAARELVSGREVTVSNGIIALELNAEEVAVLELE